MDLDDRIDELIDEVRRTTRTGRRGGAETAAWQAPLLHRTSYPAEVAEVVAKGGGALEPKKGSSVRTTLRTSGFVFFWVGRCSYPEPDMILVWAPSIETLALSTQGRLGEERALAAPWDTGGLLSSPFGYTLGVDQANALLERYSLPLPAYRRYLAVVIDGCFSQASDYFTGSTPVHWYPAWKAGIARNSGPPSHTFEVRHRGPVPVEPGLVAIVVDAGALANAPRVLRNLRRRAKQIDVAIVEPEYGETVQQAAHQFVARFLRERGVHRW